MQIYKLSYKKLSAMLVPTFLRKPRILAFVQALAFPLKVMHNELMQYRSEAMYRLVHNGQVCRLEKVLNDAFDSVERRIYIKDGLTFIRRYIYSPDEDKPLYIYSPDENKPVYIHESVAQERDADFVVVLPSLIAWPQEVLYQLKATVNYYKVAGKTFRIEII